MPRRSLGRVWIAAGGLAGFGAVAMGAVAAHVLTGPAQEMAREAVQMQGWHALALLFCGLWAEQRGGRLVDAAAIAFVLGMAGFCAGVYSVAFAATRLADLAPIGGTLLMLGWLLLFVAACRGRGMP
jgi:uncharacterized membrane protein YgdD (TMEM256/DUF423 family)